MSFTFWHICHRRLVVTPALLALAARAVLPAVASAQPPSGTDNRGGGGGSRMMAALFEGITLTDAERTAVDSIRAVYQPQMAELRSQGSGSRPQMRTLMQKETADLRGLLTSDQQSVFDKNRAAMEARMESQRQGGGTGGGGTGGGGKPPSGTN